MRRLWIQRFTWLLWLAMCSAAVLPWAHAMAHAEESFAATALPSSLLRQASEAQEALQAAAGETAATHEAGHCLVCAHLFSQHLALADTAVPAPASGPLLHLGRAPQRGQALPALGWLTPPLRGPPLLIA